jgi:hypothetical protein
LEFWCATALFLGVIWNSGVQLRCFWGPFGNLVCNFLFFGPIWNGLKGLLQSGLLYSPFSVFKENGGYCRLAAACVVLWERIATVSKKRTDKQRRSAAALGGGLGLGPVSGTGGGGRGRGGRGCGCAVCVSLLPHLTYRGTAEPAAAACGPPLGAARTPHPTSGLFARCAGAAQLQLVVEKGRCAPWRCWHSQVHLVWCVFVQGPPPRCTWAFRSVLCVHVGAPTDTQARH